MKFHVLALLSLLPLFAFTGCDPEEEPISSPRPQASFSHDLPGRPPYMKAGTSVKYTDQSTGPIDTWAWTFDNGNIQSSAQHPRVVMETDGVREMELTVTGPGGTSRGSGYVIVVGGMDPDCNNINDSRTHFTESIQDLRSRGLVREGNIRVWNDYNVHTITVDLYDPIDWLAGRYNHFSRWTLPPGEHNLAISSSNLFRLSNEWGIRISFATGQQSCIRTLGESANFVNGRYMAQATQIVN